ncbi:hypothetical protein ACJX0J_021744, partial [Zea mays]
TPQWREGPDGRRTLCNACGLRYKSHRLVPEYRTAESMTPRDLHPNAGLVGALQVRAAARRHHLQRRHRSRRSTSHSTPCRQSLLLQPCPTVGTVAIIGAPPCLSLSLLRRGVPVAPSAGAVPCHARGTGKSRGRAAIASRRRRRSGARARTGEEPCATRA